ncbi:hypothetical protein [Sorangium sp. So ce381]
MPRAPSTTDQFVWRRRRAVNDRGEAEVSQGGPRAPDVADVTYVKTWR